MHRVEGVVDVENNRSRRPRVTGTELIHQRQHQSRDLDPRRRILQPRHGRLRAQRLAASRCSAHRHLEYRVVPQFVAVVGVLVPRRDRKHPKPQHLLDRVIDAIGITAILQAGREARCNAQMPLDPAQQQHARIRRQHPAVESYAHFLAANRWQGKRQEVIFVHGGCGAP